MKKALCSIAMALTLAAVPAAQAATSSGYTQTKYPIVLVHGIFGFGDALGVDYFYQVPADLKSGGADVHIVQVSATNTNEERGEQLLRQVQQILAITGAQKVNLIGHSQGSPTSRYVASIRPDLVASVTSVDGVNKGSAVADVVRGVAPPGSVTETVAATIGTAVGTMIDFVSGGGGLPQSSTGALDSLTTAGLQKFNAKYPEGVPASACGEGAYQVNGVRYYSWTGAKTVTNIFDPLDGPIGILGLAFGGTPSDGLVSTCSAHLGQVLRDNYWMNHLDVTNQTLGLVSLFEVSPVSLYRQQANRLKLAGV